MLIDYQLQIPVLDMDNYNSPEYLDQTKSALLQYLKDLPHAPSVGIHERERESLPAALVYGDDRELNPDPEQRYSQRELDRMIQHDSEFYHDEKDQDRDLVSYDDDHHHGDHDIGMSDDASNGQLNSRESERERERARDSDHSVASSLPSRSPDIGAGAIPASGDGSGSSPPGGHRHRSSQPSGGDGPELDQMDDDLEVREG